MLERVVRCVLGLPDRAGGSEIPREAIISSEIPERQKKNDIPETEWNFM